MNPKEEIDALRLTASSLLKYVSHTMPLMHSDEILTDLDSLEIEIKSIIDSKHKKSLRDFIPRLLLRRWAVASFRMALKKIRMSRKYAGRNDELFIQQVRFAALWAYQGCDMVEVTAFVKRILSNLEHFTLYSSHLEKGDIVLSYKTNKYLKHDILARLISVTTNSYITHTLMVADTAKSQHLLSASPRNDGMGISSIIPQRGEMFIVMRYRSSINGMPREKIIESMDALYSPKILQEKGISFAEMKSWMACFIGFICALSILIFEYPICLPNPVKRDSTLYCSEFIDEVFRRAGAYLSPRSEYHSVIGPAEVFFSPFLEFKGVIFNPEDRISLIKQVSATFTLLYDDIERKDVATAPPKGWVLPSF